MGSVMIVITLGILLSNIGLVPISSPVYDATFKHLIPLSISLLLLRLHFSDIKKMDKKLLLYFGLGCMGTITGAIVTFVLFGKMVGPEAWKLSGQLTASYIGGGENAIAVGQALGVSKDLFTSAFASDNIVTALWMLVCLTAPVGLSRFFTSKVSEDKIEHAKERSEPFTSHELLPSIFYSLTVAGAIVFLARISADFLMPIMPSGLSDVLISDATFVILVTTFSLLVAQTPIRKKLKVSYMLGSLMFNYFFFTIGAISSIGEVMKLGPIVFVFVASVVAVHAIIVIGGGKLLKADLPKLFTASQACIGGPSTACALAEANEWPHLVVPGILMGVLGYALSNYLGFAIALLLR